jgi:CheY-like chemotaxis protein
MEMEKQIPIIALTANAVVGMREMFVEKGFNDFLAKPIDVNKLDEMIGLWIPKEKRELGTVNKKPENGKKFVILVDDNPANLRLGKNILSAQYRVATSPSAEKMFDILEKSRPAIILLDIDMPDINGYEAIKILKSKPETKDIPVIFIAEEGSSPDKENDFGAADYVFKPFDPPTLIACIEKHS